MHSELLVEYMRTGTISPLAKGDTKHEVEAKLGPPQDWKGRIPHIGWSGPPLVDFRDSYSWHYGQVYVRFEEAGLQKLCGISLDLGYGSPSGSFRFPPPFTALPHTPFTLQELLDLLDGHGIQHRHHRGGLWVSEGNIAIGTSDPDYPSDARVVYLFPHAYRETVDTSRSALRQRIIESFSEMLCSPDLSAADRSVCEARLRDLERENACKQ